MHGVYSNINIKKHNAVRVENNEAKLLFVKIFNVLIIASFAVIPETKAVIIFQSPSPIGVNMGTKYLLIDASKLVSLFCTIDKFVSNVCKNHIIIDEIKISVKAFSKKSFILFHNSMNVFFIEGIL